MDLPGDLRYSPEHEWVRLDEEGIATIGITDFAQDQLGDVVYLGLPAVGARVAQFQPCGEIESVKSVSDLYSPLTGEVLEQNAAAIENPEVVNQSPYADGWLWRLRLDDPAELDALLTAAAYEALTAHD